jgi:hypothetical protein
MVIQAGVLCASVSLSFQTLLLSNSDQTCFGLPAKLIATEIKTNVRDNSYRSDRDVVAGTSDVVHDGWIYSHPSRVGGGVDLDTVNTGPPDHLKRHEWLRQAQYQAGASFAKPAGDQT